MKIRPKLQIAFITSSSVLAISIMIVSYFSIRMYFEQEEGNKLKDNIQNSAKSVNNFIIQKVTTFDVLSSSPVFSIGSNEIISQYLSKKVNEFSFYDNLFFFKKNGTILSSSDSKFIGLNISQIDPDIESKFEKINSKGHKRVYTSPMSLSSQNKSIKSSPLNVELLSPVIDLDGNVIGRLVGLVNLKNLKRRLFKADKKAYKNRYSYILDGNNVILTSDSLALKTGTELLAKDLPLAFKKGKSNFYIYKNAKGIKTILAHAPLLKRGADGGLWSLISTVSYSEVMQPIYQMTLETFLAFLLITSILIVLVILFSRTISRPIIELEKAISNFEIDKKPINIKRSSTDEIGRLYKAFNKLTESLYSSYIIENRLAKEKEVINANLTHFIDGANAPVFGIDNSGLVNEWNIASEKITGYKKEEVIGKNIVKVYVPENYRKPVKKVLFGALRGKETANFEFPLINKEGQRVMILLNSSARRDANGEIIGVIGVGQNITERIKKEEQFRLVVESVPNPIILVNSKGEIVLLNKQTEIEFGYTSEELIGEKVEILIPTRYKNEHIKIRNKFLVNPETRVMGKGKELYALRKDGGEFPSEISLSTIKTSEGNHVMASIVNITARNEYEATLKDKEERVKELSYANAKIAFQEESLNKEKELSELKSKFVSTASHEFRTPLSAINFAAGSLKKYWGKMEPIMRERKLMKIEDQVLHMTNLLDDVLIVGQANSGEVRYKPLNINLGDFIDEVIKEVYSSFRESHDILLIDKEKLKAGDIFIDKNMGRNIFTNLLSNAIKFSPDAYKVTIELSSEKENILISVTDFGIGIPKTEIENIFKPFARGKNVDLIQGTGLGLSIVKEAIDTIGGEIIVKSNVGKGSSFIVKIPKINK